MKVLNAVLLALGLSAAVRSEEQAQLPEIDQRGPGTVEECVEDGSQSPVVADPSSAASSPGVSGGTATNDTATAALLQIIQAELAEVEIVIEASTRKQALLAQLRDAVATHVASPEQDAFSVDDLLQQFQRKPLVRPISSPSHPIHSPRPHQTVHSHGYSNAEWIVVRAEASCAERVKDIIVVPLAVYNPYSRKMVNAAVAPHTEITISIGEQGAVTFYTSDGEIVGNETCIVETATTDRGHTTVVAADYTFVQSVQNAMLGVTDAGGNLHMFDFSVKYNGNAIIGGKSSPLNIGPSAHDNHHDAASVAGNSYYATTVSLDTSISFSDIDADSEFLMLYSWRTHFRVVTVTRNGTNLLFVNKTGSVALSLNLLQIHHRPTGRISAIRQLGPRVVVSFGDSLYFYNIERRKFENTICIGTQQRILDFNFDALTPATIHALVDDGSVLVFDVTGNADAANPCTVVRRIPSVWTEESNPHVADARGVLESVPGYFLHLESDQLHVYNSTHQFQSMPTVPLVVSNDDTDTDGSDSGGSEDQSASADAGAPLSLIRVSPASRGWARKAKASEAGTLVVAVSADGRTVRFLSSDLPFYRSTTDISWMRYPMIAIAAVIVLFSMYQRCGKSTSVPTADMAQYLSRQGGMTDLRRPGHMST